MVFSNGRRIRCKERRGLGYGEVEYQEQEGLRRSTRYHRLRVTPLILPIGYELIVKDMSLKRKYAHEWRESWEKIDTIRDVMRQYPHHEWFWWLDLVIAISFSIGINTCSTPI